MHSDIHPIQAKLLVYLQKNGLSSFSDLNRENLSNDWFSYHIRQAVKKEWVEKIDNKYQLTENGKKLALKVGSDFSMMQNQRVSVLVVVKNKEKFVIQHRNEEPFKGFWEFPTIRIDFGQFPKDVAQSLLKNELGLKADLVFKGVNHKIENLGESIFDDKYYFVFFTESAIGQLNENFDNGTNHWISKEELLEKKHTHFDLENTFRLIEKKPELLDIADKLNHY